MPNLADPLVNTGKLLRELPFGPSQTKKTLWSGKAAEAGFNVCLLDGDGHYQILNTLTDEAKKRVHIIRGVDKLMKPQFGILVCHVFRGLPVLWDDVNNEI